ncbi:unnamed protein product [Eretmochelys imbricata]
MEEYFQNTSKKLNWVLCSGRTYHHDASIGKSSLSVSVAHRPNVPPGLSLSDLGVADLFLLLDLLGTLLQKPGNSQQLELELRWSMLLPYTPTWSLFPPRWEESLSPAVYAIQKWMCLFSLAPPYGQIWLCSGPCSLFCQSPYDRGDGLFHPSHPLGVLKERFYWGRSKI